MRFNASFASLPESIMAARRAVSRLVQDTTALFVCDIQKTFSKLVPNGDSLVHTSTMLVNAASALDMPVVVTEQSPQKLSSTCDSLKSALPETASVFEKTKFSMVTPEVEAKLQGDLRAVKSIILVGVEAHICVFQTTLDLLEKGYDVHIVADACRSQREADRLFAFEVCVHLLGMELYEVAPCSSLMSLVVVSFATTAPETIWSLPYHCRKRVV